MPKQDILMLVFTGTLTIATSIYAIFTYLLWQSSVNQCKKLEEQLKIADKSSVANIFAIVANFLQREDWVKARGFLINIDKDYSVWTEEDKLICRQAIGSWDLAGILLKQEVLDYHIVTRNWNDSIIICFEKSKAYIEEQRKRGKRDSWEGLEWIYQKALEEIPVLSKLK
jgi:hypothetical protein